MGMYLTVSSPSSKKCGCIGRFVHGGAEGVNGYGGLLTEHEKVGNVSESGYCEAGTQSLLRTAPIWGGSLPGPPWGGARSRPGNQVLDLFRRTVRDIPQKA